MYSDVALYVKRDADAPFERVTLFPDETLRLNQSVQSIQDLTKVFTDFTQQFRVPADDKNNAVFKHYYDAQITNGFDARVKQEALLLLGGATYKKGRVQLNGASLESNVPVNYMIEFFGETVKIKDLIGDEKLSDLNLTEFDHTYSPTTIRSGLRLANGIAGGDIVYPLLSYKRRYFFEDFPQDDDENINIKYDASFGSGLDWRELKPAIKVRQIIEAIKVQYSLNFTDDFFSRREFTNLFMSLGNGKDESIPTQIRDLHTFSVRPYQRQMFQPRFRPEIGVQVNVSAGDSEYRLLFFVNGEQVFQSDYLTGNNFIPFRADFFPFTSTPYLFNYKLEVRGTITATVEVTYQTLNFVNYSTNILVSDQASNTSTFTTLAPQVEIKNIVPDMKVLDFMAAIIKAFNLVIVPRLNGDLYVNDLPSWYNSGNIIDISEHVDIETLDVTRGKLYNEINFGYKDQQSVLAELYEGAFKQQFGGFENNFIGISAENELEIELPFENPQFERFTGSTLQYGFIVDKDLNAYNNAPFLFYAPLLQLDASNRLGFSGDTYQELASARIPSHSLQLTGGFAAQFNAEVSEYNGAVMSDNWYSRFYSDYINDLFSTQRRQFTLNANLPIIIASDLQLNDRLIIKGDRYIIDTIDANLITGVSKLILINDIFTTLDVGAVSKVSQSSGQFADGGAIYYTGAPQAFVSTQSDFIIIETPVVRSGENIVFIFKDDPFKGERVGTINITDGLSNPTITLLQSET
jgi:hypothetical protein